MFLLAQCGVAIGFDIERDQLGIERLGTALGGAHGIGGAQPRIEADDHPLTRCPGASDGMFAHVAAHLLIDPYSSAAKRQLA